MDYLLSWPFATFRPATHNVYIRRLRRPGNRSAERKTKKKKKTRDDGAIAVWVRANSRRQHKTYALSAQNRGSMTQQSQVRQYVSRIENPEASVEDQGPVDVLRTIKDALYDPNNPCVELFGWLEGRTGIQRIKLFFALAAATTVYLANAGVGTTLVANLIGFFYPVCVSCILSGKLHSSEAFNHQLVQRRRHELSVQWSVYWLVFAAVLIAQQLFGDLLRVVPFRSLGQVVFLVWCISPFKNNGATLVHAALVRPMFHGHFVVGDD